MTRSIRLWRDWPLLLVILSALATLLLCVASICSLAGIEIGWLLPQVDYQSLPILGPFFLGALVASSPLLFWRALVVGQRRQVRAAIRWAALAGFLLLVALGSYVALFRTYYQEDSITTSHARYDLLSHDDGSEGRCIITLYACDQSGTWCHQVFETRADNSDGICSDAVGGCFLKVDGERVLVFVGGELVDTAGP